MGSLTLAGILLASSAAHVVDPASATCMARSGASLDALVHGDYVGARKDFSSANAQVLDAGKLKQAWATLQLVAGKYSKHTAPQRKLVQGLPVTVTSMTLTKTPFDLVTTCDEHDRISTFRFTAAATLALVEQDEAPKPVTAHVEPDGVRVRPLPVLSPPGPLRGALTLPAGTGPFPAVVLVHGSGNHDMDETIGPNKPFRDIADGLAEAGIATLRYDKRNFVYPRRWGDESGHVIDSEVTDDAVAAARLLASIKAIDPHRVFVLGHSLGGMMAPRIGQRDPQLAGLILLAAPARPILDTLKQQIREQGAHLGLSSAVIQQRIDTFDREQKLLANAGQGPAPAGEFMGGSQDYWLSWSQVHQVDVAKTLSMPLLILQGSGDFQVSPEYDFAHWKQALAGKTHVTYHLYPGLGHLFTPAGKTQTIADYAQPAHVDASVINDIATWVKAQPGT